MTYFKIAAVCAAFTFLIVACGNPPTEKEVKIVETVTPVKTDLVQLKAEIQKIENDWANADNARDTTTLFAFYSDDAISLPNNKEIKSGKEAIKKDIREGMMKRTPGSTVSYDVINVYGNEEVATETGKIIRKDATGKVTYTGKYMAVWEKRDGKFICVTDIGNDDMKEK